MIQFDQSVHSNFQINSVIHDNHAILHEIPAKLGHHKKKINLRKYH